MKKLLEGKCRYATLVLQNYMCTAKTCPYGNQSRATFDFEGEDALHFCLSDGLEKEIKDERIKALTNYITDKKVESCLT